MSNTVLVARREPFGYLFMNKESEQLFAVRTDDDLDFSVPNSFEFCSPTGEMVSPSKIIFRDTYPKRQDILCAPVMIEFYPTTACNEKCRFCYMGDWLNTDAFQFPEEHIESFIAKMVSAGVFRLIVLGGEPLLYKHLPTLLDIASTQGLVISLSTNGTIDRPEVFERVIAHQVHLNVSFHSHLSEVEDSIVGRIGAFEAASNTIKKLCAMNYSPHVSAVITEENIAQIEGTVQFLSDLGVRSMSLLHTQDSGSAKLARGKCVEFDRYKDACHRAVRRGDILNMGVSATTNFPFLLYSGLTFNTGSGLAKFMYGHPDGRRILYVLNDGRIIGTLYQNLRAPRVAGNVVDDDLSEVWASSSVLEEIRGLKPKQSCLDCDHFEYCRGGPTGSLTALLNDSSEPSCPLYIPLLVNE